MSMKKILLISNAVTMATLSFYIFKKGIDVMLGIALASGVISLVLNIYCEVKYGRKED